MTTTPTMGVAAFAVDAAGRRSLELRSSPRLRGASVVKPLLFWAGAAAGPFADDRAAWERIARRAVTTSDNGATAALWSQVGGGVLLSSLAERTGVAWVTGGEGEHPALRLMVTAGELARAYAAFAADSADDARQVRRWMREVAAAQTFGVRQVACDALGAPEGAVGVKCGWFGLERAHAVVLVELGERVLGAAVTGSRPPDALGSVAPRGGRMSDSELVAAHDVIFGQAIRSATRTAVLAAAGL